MKQETDIIRAIDEYILLVWLNTGYAPSLIDIIKRFMPNDQFLSDMQLSDLIYAICVEEQGVNDL